MGQRAIRIGWTAAPRSGAQDQGLVWTEYVYFAVLAVALIVVVNPWGAYLRGFAPTKHFAFVFTLPLLLLHLMGISIFSERKPSVQFGRTLQVTWPLVVLAVFVLCGSYVAKYASNIDNNFLSMGLYMPIVVVGCLLFLVTPAPGSFLRWYFVLLTVAGLAMLGIIVGTLGARVYHEEIFLIAPLSVLFFLEARKRVWMILPGLLLFAASIVSRKNTSHLLGALILAYTTLVVMWPSALDRDLVRRALKRSALLGALGSVGALVAIVYAYRDYLLPSGNPEYRLRTYAIAWEKFLSSPIWGQGFLKAASEEFTAYQVGVSTQVLPSHSDVLDILANGGLIGTLMWLGGIVAIAFVAYRNILSPAKIDHPWSSYAHTLALCSLGAILVYAFNPVLTAVPPVAYFVWLNLGLLAGVALRAGEREGAA